ncbi:hypothetical protein AB0I28_35780 [Phytomonospora sp. NPDC050363]|uniref:hypothetical protein n=1 Tax=Phytomonospora sp. NPDC050363 TaxID=3155642 RepID=UPI0033FA4DF3
MSPDDQWVKWLVVAGGLLQAVVVIIQVVQSRRGSGSGDFSIDRATRIWVIAMIVSCVAVPVTDNVEQSRPDSRAVAIVSLAVWLTAGGLMFWAIMVAAVSVIKYDQTVGRIFVHALTIVSSILVLFLVYLYRY